MEDDHIVKQLEQENGKKGMLICVFDGHGGKEVAAYAKERFTDIFIESSEFKSGKYKEALVNCFMKLDSEIKEKEYGSDTGATSCVVYFNDQHIICANSGDSRSVLFSGNTVHALSEDHKPDNEPEL
jgi:protein phosphatase 2C family protein 2/3